MKYPPTPELDKMKAVREKSQAIGEFLDLFLSEKGMALCAFRQRGNTGVPPYRWRDGVKIAKRDKLKTAGREPSWQDVWNLDAERNPDFDEWGDEYLPVHISIEKLLAEFFEIDLNKVEDERRAILAFLRGEKE